MEDDSFLEVCAGLRDRFRPTAVYFICSDEALIKHVRELFADSTFIVPVNPRSAGEQTVQALKKAGMKTHHMDLEFLPDMGIFEQVRGLLLSAHAARLYSIEDRVLCLIHTGVVSWTLFEGRNLRRNRLAQILGGRAKTEVVEAVLDLATELLREGREGYPVGALFIIGDAQEVLRGSREGIANPFEGQPLKVRNVSDRRNWRTIKNFAALDGACIIDPEGNVVAAGRYVNVGEDWAAFLKGMGGRHSAAMVASRLGGSVAVCASQEGSMTLFLDGKAVYSVNVRG
jgi:DNA integrity scanning protein DisA with diadenylate cyclase activity